MVDRNYKFEDFDPAWNFEEAYKRADNSKHNLCPFVRWLSWYELHEDLIHRFVNGEKTALLVALRKCACNDLPMPDWVANGYISGYDKWCNFRVASLDDAFEVGLKKYAHLEKMKERRKYLMPILLAVNRLHDEGFPINKEGSIFEKVGEKYGLEKSKVRDYYYEGIKAYPNMNYKKIR